MVFAPVIRDMKNAPTPIAKPVERCVEPLWRYGLRLPKGSVFGDIQHRG